LQAKGKRRTLHLFDVMRSRNDPSVREISLQNSGVWGIFGCLMSVRIRTMAFQGRRLLANLLGGPSKAVLHTRLWLAVSVICR
jgi:hypothetical protein